MATIWEIDGYASGIVEGEGSGFTAGIAARSEEAIIDVQSKREYWNDQLDIGYIVEYAISYTTHSCASLGMGSAPATESEPEPDPDLRPESCESEHELSPINQQ